MPVNNPTQPISFQDLQDFYGGTHPIGFDEYFRDGSLVPTDRTVLAASGAESGTTSVTRDGIVVTVTTVPGGTSFGGLTTSSFSGNGVVNTADLSYVYARSEGRGNHTVVLYPGPNGSGHPTQIFSYSQDDNPGFTIAYRGAAYESGDGSPIVRTTATQYGGNRSLGFSGFRTPAQIGRRSVITNPTTYNISMRNNTGQTLNFTSNIGNNASFANGQTITSNGRSSNSWNFSYPGVTMSDANSDIPNSGNPIDLGNFRSVTNPTG